MEAKLLLAEEFRMIKIVDLEKIYDMGTVRVNALNKVNLTIEKGEFVSIVGASGSGKSTLMNILGCLDKPTSGEYYLDGIKTDLMVGDQLASIRNSKIGFVFQSFNLIPRVTAFHNVELPMIYGKVSGQERKKRAKEALEKVGLAERMDHNPNELSGGQKQRVAIARSLVNKPAIILADEPTGNLDSKSTDEIMDIFKSLNDEGVTVIIVTHEAEIADRTKRIITFRDGKILNDKLNEKLLTGREDY
jgi:putative ABC transport system ATP-binding protein